MSILITGGTGTVGQSLLDHFSEVTVTSRSRSSAQKQLGSRVQKIVEWDPMAGPPDLADCGPFDIVVHLLGESIAEGRWTAEKKQRIRDSRVLGTRHLVAGVAQLPQPPRVLISGSAVGIYGDHGENWIDERTSRGQGFLADVAAEWEAAALPLASRGTRVVWLRTGIVLSRRGGALAKMLPLYRWGLGGSLGSGEQWMPWIHENDLARLIVWGSKTPEVSGPLNAVAPHPVRNSEFNRSLARQLKRPAFFGVPAFALRAVLGEFAGALLESQRVRPQVALDNHFNFQFETLDAALADLLGANP